MNEENKNNVANEVEETKEGILTKITNSITKHKTIVTVVAVIGSGVAGYLLGSKSKNIDSYISDDAMNDTLKFINDSVEE